MNSVSTLLNKGGIACRRPTASQDFCASAKQTHTLTATLLQPCTSRHERKRGSAVTAAGKASEQHALLHRCSQASSSASKLILCQRKLPQHAKTCHRNVLFSVLKQGLARILERFFKIRFQPLEAIACGFLLLVCGEARRFTFFSFVFTPKAIFCGFLLVVCEEDVFYSCCLLRVASSFLSFFYSLPAP